MKKNTRDKSLVRRSLSRPRVSSRSPSPSQPAIPECYTVISRVEDDYSITKSTEELNLEDGDHRLVSARAVPGIRFVENLIEEKNKVIRMLFYIKKTIKRLHH